MDKCCRKSHAKLVSGTCPWCGQVILNGHVVGEAHRGLDSKPSPEEVGRQTSLHDLVSNAGPLDFIRAIRLVQRIALQLAELHAVKTIHGDVCPTNILVNEYGEILLSTAPTMSAFVDVEGDSLALENSKKSLGVADFLAPERALAGGQADGRSDVYSLGCTLYYLIAGHAPFAEGSISERLLWHQVEQAKPLNQIRANTPTQLVSICERMLEKSPDDRYTALRVVAEIDAWLAKNQ